MQAGPILALLSALSAAATAPIVAPSEHQIRPLLIGERAPDATVTAVDGRACSLKRLLAGGPAVVLFYRGGWCPVCERHLAAVADVEGELKTLGYRVIALTPDRPEELGRTAQSLHLPYELYSDSNDQQAARAFGVDFQVGAEEIKRYAGYGVSFRKASGRPHDWLPVPAVFIIGSDRRVKFVYANPDYTVRLSPSVLLEEAKAVLHEPIEPGPNLGTEEAGS